MGQFEFLRQLSLNPANTVIGLVRNVNKVEAKAKAEINRSNVHIIHGDLDSYEVLKAGLNGNPPAPRELLTNFQKREQAKRLRE